MLRRTCYEEIFGHVLTLSKFKHTADTTFSSEPTASASKTTSTMAEDPFKVFELASAPGDLSTGHFTDPLEEISKFSSSGSTKNDSFSTPNGIVHEDIDPFDGLGKSVPAFSLERNSMKGSSSPRLNTNPSWTEDKEPVDKISRRSPERDTKSKTPVENDREFPQAPFHMPTYSSFPSSTRFSQGPKSAPATGRVPTSPQFDELDDFAMGKSCGNDNKGGNGFPDED